jgi:ankyrin repeat protein
VNAKDGIGWTPLAYAVSNRNAQMTAFLINHRANVNALDNDGQSVLAIARHYNADVCAKMLMQFGARA